MRKVIIGVMGPGEKATKDEINQAFHLGELIAGEKWIVLSGGRNCGVMDAVSKGAQNAGGLTIGILPEADKAQMSPAIDIPILTGMGNGRNIINVLSSDVIVACGMGSGTASEISLALKSKKKVIMLNPSREALNFFTSLDQEHIFNTDTREGVVKLIKDLIPLNVKLD